MLTFTKDFTLQEAIPDTAIAAAVEIMKTGRLHRYNVLKGEKGATVELEEQFASYMGVKYCLACASCGSAMYLALKSAGVKNGDTVLCNAYTLAPVPGALVNAGANIVFVEINEQYTVDLVDLEKKAKSSKAKYFLISHMRGHLADMDKISDICKKYNIFLIEDCAHTMGASWNNKKSGLFGQIACYSTQTYKHMNSGEGGLFITNNPEIMAKAIIYSGSYMLYNSHGSKPAQEYFDKVKMITPNFSCRMDNLRASILLPQLEMLDAQCQRFNVLYQHMEASLKTIEGVVLPERQPKEQYVGSSIQFSLPKASYAQIEDFLDKTAKCGVQIKWFGNKEPIGFTSAYDSWQYIDNLPELPQTKQVLTTMCDMRLPLTFTTDDCDIIAAIIKEIIVEMNIS